MKKIFVLLSVIMSISFSLAQTPSIEPPQKTTTITANTPSTMDMIIRNIDRRIAYFNKYIQSGDITNIKKLISENNKDFYTNFVRYVEKSPLFTIKRDASQKIIKTPLDEYTFSALVSMNGKDTKVSMTFVEDTSGQGSKWLISDSNLHIQIPLPENEKSPLVSDALQTPTGITKTPKTTDNVKTTTEPDTKNIVEPATTNSDQIKDTPPATDKQKTNIPAMPSSAIPIPTPSAQPNMIILISISLACILLIGSVALFIIKRRKGQKITSLALAASAAAASNTVAVTPTEIPPANSVVSNVSISTVEDIHNTPATPSTPTVEPILSNSSEVTTSETPTTSETVSIPEEVPESISTISETPTVSETASIPEEIIETVPAVSETPIDSTPTEFELPSTDTPTNSLEITPISSGENISPEQEMLISAENTPSVPLTESVTSTEESIPDSSMPDEEKQITANTPIVENEQEHKSLNQIIEDAIVEAPPTPLHGNTHPLFENILNPVVTEETPSLFADILNSDTQKNTF